ncbi:sensor histidine kinase [Paenibacillus caui]|uniref:sensor histidine kinase n=1 Tax=Paenibacillus caui TaxID=2873927 RepID=UPI001CAA12EC|nr:HAMP domain-containing sensor histidine kinase [Paenibacillus caui]
MKSLYVRICLMTLATIIISSFLGFIVSNVYYHMKLKPYNDRKLTRMVQDMQRFMERNAGETDEYLRNIGSLGYEIYLTDGRGEDRFYGARFRLQDLAAENIRLVLQGQAYHGVAEFPGGPLITGFFDNRLSNTVGAPVNINGANYALFMRPDTKMQFGELRIFFAMIILFTVLFSIMLFLIAARYVVRPITRLTEATKAIAGGRYDIKLATRRRDEIGQLASHFTVMSQELKRSDQSRQEFVSNVSHEIQSPLASIQGFAAALRKKELSPPEQEHYLNIIEEESRHLSTLSKQLLTLSMLDDKEEGGIPKETVELRSQLCQVAQVMEWQLAGKELALLMNVPELSVPGNSGLLYQVWMNLLSNAVKFTPASGTIRIRAWKEGAWCKVAFSDTGEGISKEELPHVFDRFYKADKARDRSSNSSNSTGLGLSIVRKIVSLHEGTIEVSSRPGEGSTFTVTLPHL